jgi:hypothetical protein
MHTISFGSSVYSRSTTIPNKNNNLRATHTPIIPSTTFSGKEKNTLGEEKHDVPELHGLYAFFKGLGQYMRGELSHQEAKKIIKDDIKSGRTNKRAVKDGFIYDLPASSQKGK